MPILNLIVAALVLLIAYMWTAQGFFSALIHFVCTLVAGAVALAVWEPLVYAFLLDLSPSFAWTVGLVAPFLVALVTLRALTDKFITKDLKLPGAIDFAGGGLMGAGSGVISAGLFVIGIGYMPMGPDALGYRLMNYDGAGNLVRTNALWIPVDTLTEDLYERLSLGAFTPGDAALARRMPGMADQASLVRATVEGQGRSSMTPDDFELLSAYTVTAGSVAELTADGFNVTSEGEPTPQDILQTDASPYPADSVIRGYTVRFGSGASEKNGQFVIGAGQARLVCTLPDGSGRGFQPVAVVAQSSGRDLSASRYRFDTSDVFIGSAGRAKDPVFSIEFVVPADATPTDLLVKQVRVPLGSVAPGPEYTVDQRDDAVFDLTLIGRGDEATGGDRPDPAQFARSQDSLGPVDGSLRRNLNEQGVKLSNDLDGLTLSRQNRGGLNVNEDNLITSGEHTFATEDITGKRVASDLRVKGFEIPPGVSLIMIDVSLNERASLLGRALGQAEKLLPPLLTDTLGQQYEAVGYIFKAGDRVAIKYEASEPVRAIAELPSLSQSRPDDTLLLIFQVNQGVEIASFTLGGRVEMMAFDPPMLANN